MKRYVRNVPPGTEPNDPLWKEMWHLVITKLMHVLLVYDCLSNHFQNKKKELNVELAWSKNFTGYGIVVAVVDDGLEKDHRDLIRNYVTLSVEIN